MMFKCEPTSPRDVFSIRPLTLRANSGSSDTSNFVPMIGVLMVLEALMISLILTKRKLQN